MAWYIRQLQNIIRNVVVLQKGPYVTEDMLPHDMLRNEEDVYKLSRPQSISLEIMPKENLVQPLWQVEKNYIEQTIDLCDGNVTQAAELLDVSPSTLYRKVAIWKDEEIIRSA